MLLSDGSWVIDSLVLLMRDWIDDLLLVERSLIRNQMLQCRVCNEEDDFIFIYVTFIVFEFHIDF